MKRFIPLIVGFVVVAAAAADHGWRTDRWGKPADVAEAAARLDLLPKKIGDWESEEVPLDARQMQAAEVAGYVSRNYKNRRTGVLVQLLIICGRPGPVAVHTPDICYAGAGYELRGAVHKHKATDAELYTCLFEKPGLVPDPLRILWTWTTDGVGCAPDNPRFHFARADALYKVYLIRHTTRVDDPVQDDPALEFLSVLQTELKRCLSPTPLKG